jgi:hypothetical protein
MKKYVLMAAILAVLVIPTRADYYLAGEFNGWTSNGNLMSDNGDGTYTATVTGLTAGARYEFKVTDGTWDWTHPGPNSWLFADGSGQVTVTFNSNWVDDGWEPALYRIGLSTDPGAWTLAGILDWDNANPAAAMTSLGGGMYLWSQDLAAGTYEWKAVVTGSWDSISWDGRSTNTSNITLVLEEAATVNFYVDALGGMVKAEVVPEPASMALLGLGSLLISIRRRK